MQILIFKLLKEVNNLKNRLNSISAITSQVASAANFTSSTSTPPTVPADNTKVAWHRNDLTGEEWVWNVTNQSWDQTIYPAG